MAKPFPLIAALILLQGCSLTSGSDVLTRSQAELNKNQQTPAKPKPLQVPPAVSADVLSASAMPLQNTPLLPRFNLAASAVPAAEFFASLVSDSDFSIVVHPDVRGTVSLQLKQVTLPEVMAVVQQIYGFDVRQQGLIYQVYPAGLRTETIAVNYLLMQRHGLSSIAVNSGGVSQDQQNNGQNGNNQNNQNNQQNQNGDSQNGLGNGNQQQQFNGSMIQSTSKTDFWKDLQEAVQGILGNAVQRTVVVSPQAGLVTVRGMPDEIAAVRAFLQQTETHLQRQVILEAKIIEVTLNDDYQQGINWQNALANIDSTNLTLSNTRGSFGNKISGSIGGLTSIAFENADFEGVISLLSTQGDAQVLSSPRVTAVNNQKAVIKVGQDEYFVTDVSSNTTTANNGVQNTTPSITLQPFFSGIALDVTPQIDANGQVILHVHPSVTETAEQVKTIRLSNEDVILPLAQSNIRESDTIIKASNGEIVVIGGLMQTVISDQESGVPGLRSLPLLGNLFKSTSKSEKKKELVILLKPTVTGAEVWQQQIQQSSLQMQDWQQRR
ncbi:pilus (MSHA type) biogenesis protein MshL [Rheinheimera tilapiae]|uniref:Pilus (MSHA type) biogenesis protein MshL n=1 Tax=Rheinheimera tilapiae TaxID=875043 RepID=A0ABV6B743_9GAMM